MVYYDYCIMHFVVHYIMLMSFVLVYVTYGACVVSGVPHVLYVLNLLSTIKLYLNRPSHDKTGDEDVTIRQNKHLSSRGRVDNCLP